MKIFYDGVGNFRKGIMTKSFFWQPRINGRIKITNKQDDEQTKNIEPGDEPTDKRKCTILGLLWRSSSAGHYIS